MLLTSSGMAFPLGIYSVLAVYLLETARRRLLLIIGNTLTGFNEALLNEFSELITPVSVVSTELIQSADMITRMADDLAIKIPSLVQEPRNILDRSRFVIVEASGNLEISISEARAAVDSLLIGLLGMLKSIDENVLSEFKEIIDVTSQTLYKAEWYSLGPSALEALKLRLPDEVYQKLEANQLYLQLRVTGKDNFFAALKVYLSSDQVTSFGESIAQVSINPQYSEEANDIAKTIRQVGSTLQDINNNLIPSVGDVLLALGAGVGLLATSTAPTTLPVLAVSKAIIEILILLEDKLKITEGRFINISLKLPKDGKSIKLFRKRYSLWDPGDAIDQSLKVPDRDIDLFPLLDNSNKLRKWSKGVDQLVDGLNALETVDKTKRLERELKELFQKLTNENEPSLATTLIGASDDIKLLSKSLINAYNSLLAFDQKLGVFGDRLTTSRGLVLNLLSEVTTTLAALKVSIVDSLTEIVATLDTISISSTIDALYQVSRTIGKAGASLDDGYPIGSPAKFDLVNKWHSLAISLAQVLPSQMSIANLVNPVFLVIIALHILLLTYSLSLLG